MKLSQHFELSSPGSHTPVLGLQVGVDYDPATNTARPITLLMYSYPGKAFINMTLMIRDDFWAPIVDEAVRATDWVSKASRVTERRARIADNIRHGLTDREALGGLPEDYDIYERLPESAHGDFEDTRMQAYRDHLTGQA